MYVSNYVCSKSYSFFSFISMKVQALGTACVESVTFIRGSMDSFSWSSCAMTLWLSSFSWLASISNWASESVENFFPLMMLYIFSKMASLSSFDCFFHLILSSCSSNTFASPNPRTEFSFSRGFFVRSKKGMYIYCQ